MEVAMLEVEFDRDDDVAFARVSGRLDGDSVDFFETEIEDGAGGLSVMVVNLAGLEYVSSAGLRSLINVANDCNTQGVRLGFSDLTKVVDRVFDVSGFHQLLAVYPTQEAAREALIASAQQR